MSRRREPTNPPPYRDAISCPLRHPLGELTMATTVELIELLSRRHDLLRPIREKPRERHEPVDHVDASKSTVYGGVSQLVELDLVESTVDGLRPTVAGELALARYGDLSRVIEGRELLGRLPAQAVDPAALVGAEVVTPDARSVDRHLKRVEATIEGADVVDGFTPAISPDHVAPFARRRDEGELDAEFVLAADVVDHLRQDAPETFDGLLAAEGLTIWQTATDLPFTLLVVDAAGGREVVIELWDDGVVTGLVVNDTSDCREWAASTYDRCVQTAEEVVE